MCRNCMIEDMELSEKQSEKKDLNQQLQSKQTAKKKSKKRFKHTFKHIDGLDMHSVIKKQLNGQQYVKMNEIGSIYLIPGCNPYQGLLCGTNVFAVGLGKKRYLIDACQKGEDDFLDNITAFVKDQDCYFDGIFITHAHFDHMGGAQDIIDLMEELGKPKPKVYKKVDQNLSELERIQHSPELEQHLVDISEKDCFESIGVLDDNGKQEVHINIHPIETPGHLSDHLCFLYEERIADQKEPVYHIFSGDSIIGSKSTYFENYPQYYDSLLKTQKIIKDYNVKQMFVAHSLTLYPKDVSLDATSQVKDYINRRNKKDKKLEKIAEYLNKNQGAFTIDEFYEHQMSMKLEKKPKLAEKLNPKFEKYFKSILERQLQKLVVDGKYEIGQTKIQHDESNIDVPVYLKRTMAKM